MMEADVILNGETLELKGDRVAVINDAHEFTSKGAISGFAFHDRTDQSNRFVLYADGDKVRLWQDNGESDILTIDFKTLTVESIDADKKVKALNIESSFGHIAVLFTDGVQVNKKLTSKDIETESLTTDQLNSKGIKSESLIVKQIESDSIIIQYKTKPSGGPIQPSHAKMDLSEIIQDLQAQLDQIKRQLFNTQKDLQAKIEKLEGRPGPPEPNK